MHDLISFQEVLSDYDRRAAKSYGQPQIATWRHSQYA